VVYTIHGARGAIRVEDDDLEVAVMIEGVDGIAKGKRAKWTPTTERVPSNWMDASHVTWFRSVLGQFAKVIDERDFVGKEARDAFRCIELLTTAYASARAECREIRLDARPAQELKLVARR